MKIAYLIDRDSLGGGMEYVRRRMAAHPNDDCRVFFSARGECTSAQMNAWGAEKIVVNHVRALIALCRNPFCRPKGFVRFVVHGIHLRKYDFLPRTLSNRLKREARRRLEAWLYRRCDELVALTPTDKADLLRLYGADLNVRIEPNTNEGLRLVTPSGLKYNPDQFAFVCIARNHFQKGQDILFRAMVLAQSELRAKGARLLLIGGAEVPQEIDDLVENVGPLPQAGVYMICGRILIAPSRWEGMPYLLLEAVARERFVFASDCPGNRDVLRHYDKAALFPVEDVKALAQLMARARS